MSKSPQGISASEAVSTPLDNLTLPQLRDFISDKFVLDQIENICQDMDIQFENLGGTGKTGKARELVQYCKRYNKISELKATVWSSLQKLTKK